MTATQANMILLDRSTCRLARLTRQGVELTALEEIDWTHPDKIALQVKSSLDAWKIGKRPVAMGLSSPLCLSTLVRLPNARHARRHQTLTYLLEPFLPLSAEEMVADFECSKVDAFSVATAIDPLLELMDQFEEQGIRVESIVPVARLALQWELKQRLTRAPRFLFIWGDEDSVELWLIDRNRPVLWRHLAQDKAIIAQELRQIALEEPKALPLVTRNLPLDSAQELASTAGFLLDQSSSAATTRTVHESALRMTGEVLKGTATSPIEFRRDRLAPRDRGRSLQTSLRCLQLAVLCLLACVGLALFQFGEHFDQIRRDAADQQTEIFRQVYPGAAVPVGVRSRLESEHRKLQGTRGQVQSLPDSPSAVRLIERLLSSLPTTMRYRILELRIDQGRLYLVGQVREHADADRIAEELRKAQLVVENPSTHRLPQKGVEFRLSAQLPQETASTGEAKL